MDGAERGNALYMGPRTTRHVCPKVDGVHQPHHRHLLQEDGPQSEEPMRRCGLAVGPRTEMSRCHSV
jgi:hypothetical protein